MASAERQQSRSAPQEEHRGTVRLRRRSSRYWVAGTDDVLLSYCGTIGAAAEVADPGTELAGTVEPAGAAVTQFTAGDEVFGVNAWRFGAHAEFVCV